MSTTTLTPAARLRADLTAALGARYPVIGYPLGLGRIAKPTVAVWCEQVTKTDTFGSPRLRVDLAVWVLVSVEDLNRAADALDPVLLDLYAALQPLGWVDWSTSEWLALDEASAVGFKTTVTALTEPITST